ncbi:ABC transporter substrate-binding protein [Nesterenkonia muleiensis]|uniref:ABC transporter substrate-binding protein n=1 Tax=Nesterenkonia muleiensis TaxID=2282648 RepID=UPI000E7524E1|nr:ABC transporter substrate-binding protein [Nesterenkonia muleiensis]
MKKNPMVAVTSLALLTLAACGTGEAVDLNGDADDVEGAVLQAAIGGEPDQLDPHRTSAYFSFQVLENVFDTLVEPDENLEMQPALAESWDVSEDQLTWTFQLREDVTFHDGSEFTSADVVYSYERIIDEELANAWRFDAVESVEAPDDHTVEITVSAPTPNLLSNIGGFKGMAIVSEDNVESDEISNNPIGTGPFSLASYTSGDQITLEANPDYWGGAPEIAGVEFSFISEPSTALAALSGGEIHWTDNIPPQQVEELDGSDSVDLEVIPSNDYWYLAMNINEEPWDDERVRQAIAYAIDREAIIQAVSYGTAQENQLAIPEESVWYTEYSNYTHDLSEAERLLEEADVDGGSIEFLATNEYPETVTAAQIIADNLEPLGFEVSISQPDFSTWLDDQNSGSFDMLMMGWLGNIDPDDFYYSQHHSDGGSNAQGYSNQDVDELLESGRTETDEDARAEIYAEAAQIIADEASYIYLYNPAVIQGWSPELSDYQARSDAAIRFRGAVLEE